MIRPANDFLDAAGPSIAAAVASARDAPTCDPRLAEALEAYRAELLAGRRVERRVLYARYPDLAATLAECLDALEFLQGAAHDLSHDTTVVENRAAALPAHAVLGDFRLLRELGRGGMGVVYEAEQRSLRRRVAVKVLPAAATLDPRLLQRFHNEAHAAACLHHPHIVPVYAVGTEGGVPYYAMQYIDGMTLAAVIDRHRRPGASVCCRTVAQLGLQAAQALDHAHQMGVVHRDIKPANLLLDTAGNLWITDFGLALLQGSAVVTMTGDVVGTLRYMSPEQALGKRGYVDQRTDIYSLGVTLYEWATLEAPFGGDERQHVLRQVIEDEPLLARHINPAVPADLETILAKAMAKEPRERYATAQELADDLQRFLDDRPIRARRAAFRTRVFRWGRRHRSLAVSAALSLVLVAAGALAAVLSYAWQQAQLAAERGKLAEEKAEQERTARHDLFETLVGRAAAMRRAREPGYRARVWDDLRKAVALNVPDMDRDAIRREVIACLSDPIGLDPMRMPEVERAAPRKLPAALQGVLRDRFSRPPAAYAVSPNGLLLATYGGAVRPSGGWPTGLLLWNTKGELAGRDRCLLGPVHSMEFTPDGRSLIGGCDEGIMRWAVVGGVENSVRTGNVHSLAVHPSGRLLATTGGRQIELWSLNTNRLIAVFPAPAADATVEFGKHGDWLVAVQGGVPTVGWRVTWTPERQLLDGHQGGVPALAFSPDGKLLATASKDRLLRLWDVTTGRLRHNCYRPDGAAIEALAFSPDSTIVATGDVYGMIILWDVGCGKQLGCTGGIRKPPGQVWQLQFDAAAKHLVAGAAQGLFAWTVERGGHFANLDLLWSLRPSHATADVYDLAVHPTEGHVVFLDAAGKLSVCALAQPPQPRPLNIATRVALRGLHFDSAGALLTYLTDQGRLGLWDWRGQHALPAGAPAFHLALDPSGRLAAASTPAQGVLIHDVAAAATLLALPTEGAEVWTIAWSPDATRVAAGLSDGSVAMWNLQQVRATLREVGVGLAPTRPPRLNQQPP